MISELASLMLEYEKLSGKPMESLFEDIEDDYWRDFWFDWADSIRKEKIYEKEVKKTLEQRILSPNAYKKRRWI